MSNRRNRRVTRRPRSYVVVLNAHDSNTPNLREAIATPNKGKRLRILRVRAVQEGADGRHLYELYFGTGADITTDADKAVDILDIPNLSEASTRTFLREEGPRGLRDEVLSGRWAGTAPSTVHKIMVEYTEES
jgi:hypothetical protein